MNIATQGMSSDEMRTRMGRLAEFALAIREDSGLAGRLETDPRGLLDERGIHLPAGFDIRVEANTRDTFHLVLPPDPNAALADEELSAVAGGKSAGTVGSVGSGSTASTAITTMSSASTAGSVGSAGTAS